MDNIVQSNLDQMDQIDQLAKVDKTVLVRVMVQMDPIKLVLEEMGPALDQDKMVQTKMEQMFKIVQDKVDNNL